MRNVSDKIVEKFKTHNLCAIIFFSEKCVVYEIIFKKNYGRNRQAKDYNTIRRMRIALCISKATDTHSEYVITATKVSRTPLRVTLCSHCLPCLLYNGVCYCFSYGKAISAASFWCAVNEHMKGKTSAPILQMCVTDID